LQTTNKLKKKKGKENISKIESFKTSFKTREINLQVSPSLNVMFDPLIEYKLLYSLVSLVRSSERGVEEG
jgi:hypothetical protein